MEAEATPRGRQFVDWSAALWAGLLAGTLFLALLLFVFPLAIGIEGPGANGAWVMLRYLASAALGETVLAPPATLDGKALGVALVTHFAISIGWALLIAVVLHRFGIVIGVIGGALFGLALYAIHVYGLTYFRPWFFALQGLSFATLHVLFGALAGGVYEWLEVEEFELVPDAEVAA